LPKGSQIFHSARGSGILEILPSAKDSICLARFLNFSKFLIDYFCEIRKEDQIRRVVSKSFKGGRVPHSNINGSRNILNLRKTV